MYRNIITAVAHGCACDLLPEYRILSKNTAPPLSVVHGVNSHPLDQTPSLGPRATWVRLADAGASLACADIRAALDD